MSIGYYITYYFLMHCTADIIARPYTAKIPVFLFCFVFVFIYNDTFYLGSHKYTIICYTFVYSINFMIVLSTFLHVLGFCLSILLHVLSLFVFVLLHYIKFICIFCVVLLSCLMCFNWNKHSLQLLHFYFSYTSEISILLLAMEIPYMKF